MTSNYLPNKINPVVPPRQMYHPMKECKCCGNQDLRLILDLDRQPLANNLIEEGEEYEVFELALNLCENCFHTQLTIAVDPKELFSNYLYVSGTSATLKEEFNCISKYLCRYFHQHAATPHDKISVLDIASNDGTFLKYFKALGCDTLGIDPATNLCEVSRKGGIETINGFFGSPAMRPLGATFDIITAFNVFAHIEHPRSFMKEIYNVLAEDGICAIQTSQRDMFLHSQFDTIYHEHHHFYSIMSFYEVCRENNFYLYDVKFPDIHGGSYLFIIGKDKSRNRVEYFLRKEREEGRYDVKLYNNFSQSVEKEKVQNLKKIRNLKDQGYRLIGFGAAAKGIVLLNWYDLKLDYVIDENPLKFNKIIPKVATRVISIEEAKRSIATSEKICFVILPWNFKDEISYKIKKHFDQEKEIVCILGNKE